MNVIKLVSLAVYAVLMDPSAVNMMSEVDLSGSTCTREC